MRRIGAHLSVAAGLHKAVDSIGAIGGNCLQIFSGSPRGWQKRLPSKEEVKKFRDLCKEENVRPVFIHAKYLINLASEKKSLYDLSVKSLKHDMKVAGLIGSEGVVVHLGSHLGRGFSSIQQQLVRAIKDILQDSPKPTELIIENSAGQKGKICSQLSEIKLLLQAVNSKRLKWCLDTCHAWSAGLSFGKDLGNTLQQFDLVKSLVCLHINDSRDGFNSGRDRHANLGEGKMGLKELARFVNYPAFQHLPLIIETPGFNNEGPDKKNLDILKSLIR